MTSGKYMRTAKYGAADGKPRIGVVLQRYASPANAAAM
jgi:hypothetical protein